MKKKEIADKDIKKCTYICHDCAQKNNGFWPEDRVSTWFQGICDMCNQESPITNKRYWDYNTIKSK